MKSTAERASVSSSPHERVSGEGDAERWALDLSLIGVGALLIGVALASTMGVWSPWEAQIAQALEHMSAERGWLTVRLIAEDGSTFKSAPLLPFGWWLSALSYQLLPTELGLRLPHVLLTSLSAVTLYSAARHCFTALGERHARRGAWVASALWLATPASALSGLFALGGLGPLSAGLASLWWLTPLAARPWGGWVGLALCASAGLSLGVFGLLGPLVTLLGARQLFGAEGGERLSWGRLKWPVMIAALAVSVALWRLSIKSAYMADTGGLQGWLALLALHASPFETFELAQYRGFQGVTHLLAYALLPLGVMVPSALVELLGEGRPQPVRALGSLLAWWFGLTFLALALNSAWAGGTGALTPLLTAPAALGAGLLLLRSAARPSLSLQLTSGLFLALILSDLKRDPSLLLSPIVGQAVEGLDARFIAWKPVVVLGYVGLSLTLVFLTPARELLTKLMALVRWGGDREGAWLAHIGRATLTIWALGALGATLSYAVGLSDHLSQRDLLNSYQRIAAKDEPLTLYGMSPKEASNSFYLRRLEESPREALKLAAKAERRAFFIIKRAELSKLNKRFRRHAAKHLTILDDSSHELLLASNQLKEGERDLNPIGSAVLKALPEGVQRLKEPFVFEDRAELIGWSLEPSALKIGAEARLKLYWRALKKMRRSWKVFVHIDASGQRIHADHYPVEGLYPSRDWTPGDLIQDVYPFKVKSSVSPAVFKVHVGLYSGKTRLKINKGPAKRISKDNRALLGRVRVY